MPYTEDNQVEQEKNKEKEVEKLSSEEKEEVLKTENLESLSTEEYLDLWKKLNPYYVSHVTRQGFRDHYDHYTHSGGLREYSSGFKEMLKDKKTLRSPFGMEGLHSHEEEDIERFLENKEVLTQETKKEALEKLDQVLDSTIAIAPKHPDKTAVHFAVEEVLDRKYGGETENEIFFIMPSDVIASQYRFGSNNESVDFSDPYSDNDVFIWNKKKDVASVSLDAGIVFLPKDTMVHEQTGSRYEHKEEVIDGEKRKIPQEDEKMIENFLNWVQSHGQETEITKAADAIGEELDFDKKPELKQKALDLITVDLLSMKMDVKTVENIREKVLYFIETRAFRSFVSDREYARTFLQNMGNTLKKVENGIRADEYWEKYFTKHPEQRPKHIVYYNGDPDSAVQTLLQQKGIQKHRNEDKNEFQKNNIENMENDPILAKRYDDLRRRSEEIIERHYKK